MLLNPPSWFALVIGACSLLACGDKAGAASDPPIDSPALKAEAANLFSERCARCHGALGKGDGPDAAKLVPRPRNFSDPTWQLAIPDRQLDKVIVQGGASVGKSSLMPANPDLEARPELRAALRQHLRVLASAQ